MKLFVEVRLRCPYDKYNYTFQHCFPIAWVLLHGSSDCTEVSKPMHLTHMIRFSIGINITI